MHFIQPVMTSSAVEPRRSSRALPKAKLAPKKKKKKKVMVTLWWSAAHLIHSSFLNPSRLHLRNTLSKSMRGTENCNARSWRWPTERARFLSMTVPNCTSYNQRFKSWTHWAAKFCLICHIHLTPRQPAITSSTI